MEIVTIRTFSNLVEANLVKARFESEGIHCNIINKSMDTAFKFDSITVDPIRLQVRSEDLEKAKDILGQIESERK